MKKVNLMLLIFAVSVGLSSCKKDDSENNNAKIQGKWNLKKEIDTEYLNNQKLETDEYVYEPGAYAEFKSNGTLEWNEDGSDAEIYSYKVDGNKLTLIEEGDDEDSFTIKELTSSKLVLYSEEITSEAGQTFKETYELILEK